METFKYLLTVICITYNHEKYLCDALDSVLNQKVNFSMEVIIAEDCSTDASRSIIDKYCKMHPGFFKVIYRENNVGPQKNLQEAKLMSSGKYLIYLETDDYWTDPYKLQKQIDWLEKHPATIAVTHKCKMIDDNNTLLDLKYPSIDGGYYKWSDYLADIMPGQTATMMVRNYYKYPFFDSYLTDKSNRAKGPGDRRRYFMLLIQGDIYCMNEYMSVYRFVKHGGSSFTATNKNELKDNISYYKEFVEYTDRIHAEKNVCKVAEALYIRSLWIAFLHHDTIGLKELLKMYKKCKFKLFDTFYVIKYYTKRIMMKENYYYKKESKR